MEKEYIFTIEKLEHPRGKPFMELRDGKINRGYTLKEIQDLHNATKKTLEEEE
jgi:hypothetical protein